MKKIKILGLITQFLKLPTVGPLIALLLACVFFYTQTDRFLDGNNLSLIVQQVMVVGTLAIGQTLIILTKGIDLSNGMIMAFAGITMTKLAVVSGIDPILATTIGISAGALFGFFNGALVTWVKLPPFIVTLGTLNIAFALTRIYSTQSIVNLPDFQIVLGNTFTFLNTKIAYGTIVMIALYFIVWYILSQTPIGRHIYALGDNSETARLTGIRTNRLLLLIYTIAGFFYGLAALLLVARTNVGDPQAGQTANLDSITAVVLGGTSLFGGRGSIIGTLIGALIVGVFRNGLQLMGVSSIYQVLITGILVIIAVTVDQFSRDSQS
ncbi:ABC transporter permease [Spirochaetota bacterium]|nr:ABC transporter permease [Spirochaetota bacterium]